MASPSSKQTLEELMLSKNLLTEEQLEKAKNIQAQTLERLEDILIRLGYLSEKDVLELWSEFLGVSIIDLTNIKVDAKVLSMIPEYQAKQYKVIPYRKSGNKLTIVMADPFDIMAKDMIAFLTQCKLEVLIAPRSQIELAIKQLYSWEGFRVAEDEERASSIDESTEVVRKTSEEGPVVQFLNAIFKQAILKRASDIHIEPREEMLLVRFRIDGKLHDVMTGPKSLLAPLISRIKILSHLDIAEKRLPQDGRLKVRMENKEIDFRVSTVPSLLGEKAVLRILQRESAFDLDNLGFLPDDLAKLKAALDEPYGMVLVTGPTGAGKTTTLFGMLKYFNNSEINIFTIEDPIEYRIEGITQVQTNEKIGLDFAHGLRAALRQDPDIILVGEIRDIETAEIAFRASLTGHKVLSTLHTNNAAASVNRLINMGVPPYLVCAALRVVIAQKLLHKICNNCKIEYRPSQNIIQRLKIPQSKLISSKFYKGAGCKECNQTGGYGRIGVYETMIISPAIRSVIMEGGSELAIKRIARLEGMKTLREIALQKAFEGLTTLEEVLYVTPSDEEQVTYTSSILYNIPYGVPTPKSISHNVQFTSQYLDSFAPTMSLFENNMINSVEKTIELNLDDPIIKSIAKSLDDDFLFFTNDELAQKLNLPPLKVAELLEKLQLTRDREGFFKKYSKYPENLTQSEATNIWLYVQEKQGKLPDFIFDNDESATVFVKAMIDTTVKNLTKSGTTFDNLPKILTKDLALQLGLEPALKWSNGSLFKLVNLTYPDRFKPWEFGEIELLMNSKKIEELAKEVLNWLMTVKLGCSRGDLPNLLTKEIFIESGLEPLLAKFGNSIYKLVQAVYPNVFKPWQFVDEEAMLWFREDKLEIAKEATKWLIEKRLNIPVEEIPKKISLQDFHHHGLAKLADLFNQNLFLIIDNAYPNMFKPWEFSEMFDIWHSNDALQIAKEATLWLINEKLQWNHENAPYQLSRRHFINYGLGFMLGILFNHSPFMALENCYENLRKDEFFQKILLSFAQEVRDIQAKWLTLAEKISLTYYGKVKFKVTLPNIKIAPIIPETDRIYYNSANQIEYVPMIIVPKISAYDDLSDFHTWVPFCDKLNYWILLDDRISSYNLNLHPKVKLIFSESLISMLRNKGLHDIAEKVIMLRNSFERLLDKKAPVSNL